MLPLPSNRLFPQALWLAREACLALGAAALAVAALELAGGRPWSAAACAGGSLWLLWRGRR